MHSVFKLRCATYVGHIQLDGRMMLGVVLGEMWIVSPVFFVINGRSSYLTFTSYF